MCFVMASDGSRSIQQYALPSLPISTFSLRFFSCKCVCVCWWLPHIDSSSLQACSSITVSLGRLLRGSALLESALATDSHDQVRACPPSQGSSLDHAPCLPSIHTFLAILIYVQLRTRILLSFSPLGKKLPSLLWVRETIYVFL